MNSGTVIVVIAALTLALAGCATPPNVHRIENSRSYSKSKDAVWSNLIEFFSENNIQIKTLEKDSGVVYADVMGVTPGLSVDCGGPGIWAVISTSATVNVFVRKASGGEVAATVNIVGTQEHQLGARYRTVRCVSTGHIERRILDALSPAEAFDKWLPQKLKGFDDQETNTSPN